MSAFVRAMHLYERGQLREAIPYFQRALVEQPDDVNVLYRTMLTLVAMRDYAGCARFLTDLLPHVNPTETPPWIMGGFHYNLAIAHEASGRWAQAERHHRTALAFEPDAILPKICIGSNCYRQGKPDEGKRWHDQALEPETVEIESRPARSFVKLLRGDYLGGFAEYESRWKLPQVLAHSYVPKDCWRWKGKPLNGTNILVVGEQGIGDTILMARYLPLIEQLGGKIVLVCNPTLHRLFRHNFPNVRVYNFGERHPPCRWWAPMMSLPFVFKTTRETIPSGCVPYLKPIPTGRERDSIALRVGYVSRGNPLFMGDADRSAPADAFDPLLNLASHHVIHFEHLDQASDKARGFTDFADTAALVSQLDLVITVDTAIGHLAGALGVPTWLLPMTSLHWLWGLPEELASPWYPKHRLWRRKTVDGWAEVVESMRKELLADQFIRENRL